MTFQEAYDRLLAAWPRRSFNIDLEVWHHDHTDSGNPPVRTVEWSIWDEDGRVHHRGPTLETAMTLALGVPADLAAVEQQIEGLSLVQGGRT